jgi:hypothetical protein
MTGNEMLTTLGLRVEDTDDTSFSQATKLDALNIAQKTVIAYIDNLYLRELEIFETKAMSSNAVALSSLNSIPIRNGIIGVKVSTGKWAPMISPSHLKGLENSYMSPTATEPISYVFSDSVYCEGPAANANIEIWYLKKPSNIGANATECILNVILHEIVLDLAEAQLWEMDAKLDRGMDAKAHGMGLIQVLNERVQA